ncbi:MAG: hypothetical protein AAB296_00730, partial [Candidatus Desantisbacteria bacterium]
TQYYGTKTITVVGVNSGRYDDDICKVVARLYQVLPIVGTVGSTVTICGDGYSNYEILHVKFGKYNVDSLSGGSDWTSASPAGTFSVYFVVSTQSAGTTTITVTGDINRSNQEVKNIFYINGKILSVLPSIGTIGSRVTVTGNGFISSDSVKVDFGSSQSITMANTSVDGTFSAGFTVDVKPLGTVTITAKDRLTEDTNTFIIKSALTKVSPTSGTVGTIVSVSGNGFKSNEAVKIDFGSTMSIAASTIDVSGSLSSTFTIDEQKKGITWITATGIESGATGTIDFSITHNLVYITPTAGTVGSQITAYGNGYVPGTITIDFGNVVKHIEGNINQKGTFTIGFMVNTQPYGSTVVKARDGGYNEDFETYIIKSHIIQVSPMSGTVGSVVSVSGNGYSIAEQIRIGFGMNNTITIIIAGNSGAFSDTFTVDVQPSGTVTVTAAGLADQVNHVDTNSYRIKGNIVEVMPLSGTIGSSVTVTGNGFGASEGVQIGFGNMSSIATAQAAGVGTFSVAFTVNTQVYGTKTVKATGLTTSDMSDRYFVLTPDIYLVTPINGIIGTPITITGNGYESYGSIIVDFGTEMAVSSC